MRPPDFPPECGLPRLQRFGEDVWTGIRPATRASARTLAERRVSLWGSKRPGGNFCLPVRVSQWSPVGIDVIGRGEPRDPVDDRDVPVALFDQVVVEAAEADSVVDLGPAAGPPGHDVVRFGPE